MDVPTQLRQASQAALAGDPTSQQWLHSLCHPPDNDAFTKVCQSVICVLGDGSSAPPIRFLLLTLLRKVIEHRWEEPPPPPIRQSLLQETFKIVEREADSECIVSDLAISVLVLEGFWQDMEGETVSELIGGALSAGRDSDTPLPIVRTALKILQYIAEETAKGNRLCSRAAGVGKFYLEALLDLWKLKGARLIGTLHIGRKDLAQVH